MGSIFTSLLSSFSEFEEEEELPLLTFLSVRFTGGAAVVGLLDGSSSESDEEEDEPSGFLLASFPLKTA